VQLLKSLSSLQHHSHKGSSSTLSCHSCSLLTLRQARRGNWLRSQTQHYDNSNCPLSNALPWKDTFHKHFSWASGLTTCQLLLLTFGGGEFSSCLHNCYPVILKSSPLLSSQILTTDRGGNLALPWRRFTEDFHAVDGNQSTDIWETCSGALTFVPCLRDFSLCTTKIQELQVVEKSSAGFWFFSSPSQLPSTYSKLPQWWHVLPFWGVLLVVGFFFNRVLFVLWFWFLVSLFVCSQLEQKFSFFKQNWNELFNTGTVDTRKRTVVSFFSLLQWFMIPAGA